MLIIGVESFLAGLLKKFFEVPWCCLASSLVIIAVSWCLTPCCFIKGLVFVNVFGCPKPQLQSGFCDVCFGLLFSQRVIFRYFQLWSKYPSTKKQSPFPPISSTQPQRGEMCRVVFWRLGQGPPGPSTGGFPSLVVLTRAVKFCRCNFGVSLCAAAARGWLRCLLVGC